jgi:predicted O-methyltransferase YrrM
MTIETTLRKWIVAPLRRRQQDRAERARLASLPVATTDGGSLRGADTLDLGATFQAEQLSEEWREVESALAPYRIPDGTDGVNPGDRRALYYLVRRCGARRVLEIGTHIGASTVHIALALRRNASEAVDHRAASMTTVDIEDVNGEEQRRWLRFGAGTSPRRMIEELGCGGLVTFVHRRSIDFLHDCDARFDLIFLDGNHDADTVYQEVPLALQLLSPGGIVVLHDYFPLGKPLWSNRMVIQGPFLAIQRFRREGAPFTVLPCGELPWPTKLGSRVSSLAVLAGESARAFAVEPT